MTKHYAVVFDNDPDEEEGLLQFVLLDRQDQSITTDLDFATEVLAGMLDWCPEINYRVVEVIIKELE